jgi:cyclophilin family peptidyl-prolyl cis-trans isomerase
VRRLLFPPALLLAAAVAALLSGCGSGSTTTTTTTASVCTRVPQPELRGSLTRRKPTALLSSALTWTATVETNCGSFVITLDVADSPKTTGSFATLARAGFYDDLPFHRIARDFVIQGGDPTGGGAGGPGYTVTEAPPRSTRYTRGVVAMAKTATDPDGASGSQFFIVTGEDANLPPQYALLGEITSGMDVVERINNRPLESSDPQGSPPVDPVVIERVTIAHD